MQTLKGLLAAGVAIAALAGCESTERSQAIRATLESQIRTYNAAGVDPVQLGKDDPQKLLYLGLGCATLTSLSSVINPGAVSLSGEISEWCKLAVEALAPAGSPVPEAKPSAEG